MFVLGGVVLYLEIGILCFCRSNKVVNIYDRHGEHKSSVLIVLPGYTSSSVHFIIQHGRDN